MNWEPKIIDVIGKSKIWEGEYAGNGQIFKNQPMKRPINEKLWLQNGISDLISNKNCLAWHLNATKTTLKSANIHKIIYHYSILSVDLIIETGVLHQKTVITW